MSKRCELQKQYFQEFGNYKGNGKYSDNYVKWLEDKVIGVDGVVQECKHPFDSRGVVYVCDNCMDNYKFA